MSRLAISLNATSLNDVPIFQVVPSTQPHPNIHQHAWVLDYSLGHPSIICGSHLYLWYPHHDRVVLARVGMPFRIHGGYAFYLIDSTVFIMPQAIAVPLHRHYSAPPPDLTVLRFCAYAQPIATDLDTGLRLSMEADHGHTPP